ncbi:hypothetical protein [Hydrogenophaga laconesensis]|uniref:Uncharacterized protein n=1 Tax=Hydrogenophaga laconesensis TaxID=1805971 RepID=A0ABU1V7N6_9BURK|nr:hypothetical protein [Hydrogenophaga laconesensis]MDR7093442.1 hypothetical protein [Hydrogenophaga laconesensis]
MNGLFDFFGRVLRGVLRLVLVVASLIFVFSLLLAAIVVMLGVSLWALVTGRKPTPAVVFSRFRQTSQRYTQGVWPGSAAGGANRSADVVDVEATEVPDAPAQRREPGARSGPDTMARVLR